MTSDTKASLATWNETVQGHSADEVLRWAVRTFGDCLTFASSMGLEDQVLLDLMVKAGLKIRVFTLDTGRLFPETLELIHQTETHYGIRIEVFYPSGKALEAFVGEQGLNAHRQSVELRKACCHIRKVEPLGRALAGSAAWICGLRREQAVTRQALKILEWDPGHDSVKISPLLNWSEEEVRSYAKEEGVPINPLHEKNFPSIGCACCTRAVKPGEDVRAGRWWWEEPEKKECGLHLQNGKLRRT